MYLKRTALPIAGICLSLLVGCEPTHIKNGFASEAEMTQLNAMGYEKFEHFQNRGNFSSPERAREALEKGFKTNEELNADYLQTLIQRNDKPQKSGIRREDYDSYTEYASAVSAANKAGGSKAVSSAATSPVLKISNVDEALNIVSMIDDYVMRDKAISAYRTMRTPQKLHVMGDIAGTWTYPHLTEAFCDEDAALAAALTDKSLVEQAGNLCTEENLKTLRTARAKQAEEARKVAELEAAKQLAEENKKYGVGMVVECSTKRADFRYPDQNIWIRHVTKNRATMMGYDEKEFGFGLKKRSHTMLWEPNAWYYAYYATGFIKRWESDSGLFLKSVQLMKTGDSAGLLRLEGSDDRLCRKRSESDYLKMKADRLAMVNQAAAEKKSVSAQAERDAAESLKSSEF